MSEQTTQIKLLAVALGLNRANIAEIIELGGITVSKSRVDSWLRSKTATKNFCVGLKPWLDSHAPPE